MCRRRLHAALLVLLGATGTIDIAPATAQTSVATQTPATARRAELGAHIDSLIAVHSRHAQLAQRRDSLREARASLLRTDTVAVGPFLFVDRTTPTPGAVAALEHAWQSYESSVGRAVARLHGIVITLSLARGQLEGPDAELRMYRFEAMAMGHLDHANAADNVMANVLMDALPDELVTWLDGGSLRSRQSLNWAYRDLATSRSEMVRRCFASDVRACRTTLIGAESDQLAADTRASLFLHALELGGADAYARLLDDAPDVATRLAHAANRPIDELLISWRHAVQEARPRVLAGVIQDGLWAVLWLTGLSFLAMRSTRWRLG
jgi:hypothetical protein